MLAIVCTRNLTTYSGGCVGVISEVGGHENRIREAVGAREGPQGRLQALYDVTRPANVRLCPATVRSASDCCDALPCNECLSVSEKDSIPWFTEECPARDSSE